METPKFDTAFKFRNPVNDVLRREIVNMNMTLRIIKHLMYLFLNNLELFVEVSNPLSSRRTKRFLFYICWVSMWTARPLNNSLLL